MRKLLFLLLALFALMVSCSRESNITPDPSLDDSSFVVMVLRERPDSLGKFIDSISRLDKIVQPDTMGFTINDTVYLLGYKFKNGDKLLFTWFIDKLDTLNGKNGEIYPAVFTKEGLYTPKFMATERSNNKDSAGHLQYLRIVNTIPRVQSLRDTVWARNASPARVPLHASDEFGRIVRIRLDNDADGKWDSTFAYPGPDSTGQYPDTVWAQMKQVAAAMDSLGNQKAVIQAEDDDAQTVTDTLVLHFNRLPAIQLDYPADSSRVSNQERFAFYFHATDIDNPAAIRYFVRTAKSPDNLGTAPILTNKDLIASNLDEKTFELQDKDGKRNPAFDSLQFLNLYGRLYWDVWCTDGFDTVYAGKRTFFYGDLTQKYGMVKGYVKMQGLTDHDGIRVTLQDTVTGNKIHVVTDTANASFRAYGTGFFSFSDVPPGYYRLSAVDTLNWGFNSVGVNKFYVEMGDVISMKNVASSDTLWLTDTKKPAVYLDVEIPDTIYTRTPGSPATQVRFFVGDYGSQVAESSIHITLAGVEMAKTKDPSDSRIWIASINTPHDTVKALKIWAVDKAGNVSDTTKKTWRVNAKKVALTINGKPSALVNVNAPLVINAAFSLDTPSVALVNWNLQCTSPAINENSAGSVVLRSVNYTLQLSPTLHAARVVGNTCKMTVTGYDASGTDLISSISFGFKDSDQPSAIFTLPAKDTTVSINDPVAIAVEGYEADGNAGTDLDYSFTCTAAGMTSCPANVSGGTTGASGTARWTTAGTKTVSVTATDAALKTSTASVRTITVKTYAPTVRIRYTDSLTATVKSTTTLTAVAFDTVGTIDSYEWRCGNSLATLPAFANGSATYSAVAPATAQPNYTCQVRVTDDDGNMDTATTKLPVIVAAPKVTVAVTSATVTVKDSLKLQAIARDTLNGTIDYVRWSCGAPGSGTAGTVGEYWAYPSGTDTTLVAPDTAATSWLCIVEAVDNDGNIARDSSLYKVLADKPSVTTVDQQLTKTIKDVIVLDAYATDGYGYIAKYEWSCGTAGVAGKGNWITSVGTPRYSYTLPATSDANYMCVIRVSDDDGQTAMDTTRINLLQDAPVITVTKNTITVSLGNNITLGATATDGYGSIAKREWNCGLEGSANWKTVSSFDTIWKAPATMVAPYHCVARVTDDDGNIARDTMVVTFTDQELTIKATPALQYVRAGDPFDVYADTVGPWPALPVVRVQCGSDATIYEIQPPGMGRQYPGTLTTGGNDFICTIEAKVDESNWTSTTMSIKVLKDYPVGVLSLADSAFVWSGDLGVPAANMYFYTSAFNASSSILGTLGNASQRQFWWSFSHFEPTYWFQGNGNGTIDTSVYQFNEAFKRLTTEGTSITIGLDFRDSTPVAGETDAQYLADFGYRHNAALVYKSLKFYKAWRNILPPTGSDTVLTKTAASTYSQTRMVWRSGNLVVAYINASGLGEAKIVNPATGATVTALGTFGSVSQSLRLAVDASNGNIYVAYVNGSGKVEVRKSTGGTFGTALGGALYSGIDRVSLAVDANYHRPIIAYHNASSYALNAVWYNDTLATWVAMDAPGAAARVADIAVSAGGKVGLVFVDNTTSFVVYNKLYSSTASGVVSDSYMEGTWWNGGDTALACTFNGETFAVVFPDRTNSGNPLVRERTGTNTWVSKGTVFGMRIGGYSSITYLNGYPVVAFDDRIWTDQAQIHVWKYDGSAWRMLGENQLPYFGKLFSTAKGYYLRGSGPIIAVGDGELYLGMHAMEMGTAANPTTSGRNDGPLVQKYIGP